MLQKKPTPHSHSLGTALSDHDLSPSHASQSDFVVGKSPIALTFQIPNASIIMFVRIYVSLTPMRRVEVPGVSKRANVFWRLRTAMTGVLKSEKTMKMEKICSVLPVMYIPRLISTGIG